MRTIMRSSYIAQRPRKTIRVRPTMTKKGMRKGYTYVSKGGAVRVKAVPIKDVGAAGKGPKLIGKLKAGMLTKYHYHPVEGTAFRHKALTHAVKKGKENPLAVMRRLIAISTLTKKTLPRASRIYRQDFEWVRRTLFKSKKRVTKHDKEHMHAIKKHY